MPRGDGTGPMGLGPMTGRAAGFCAGFTVPGYMNPVYRRGIGFGRGRGFRRMYYLTGLPGWARYGYAANIPFYGAPIPAVPPAVNEKELLKNQASLLEEQLQEIKERLKALDNEEGK